MSAEARMELRGLIAARLRRAGIPEDMIRAVTIEIADLFSTVRDRWDEHDITSFGDMPGTRIMMVRWLVAEISRETVTSIVRPAPNRTVEG